MTYLRLAGSTALATLLATGAFAQTELSMWYHGAGNPVELELINKVISDFNASQSDWVVTLETFPRSPTTTPSSLRRWPATCPTSSTLMARSCRTGPGPDTFSRCPSMKP